jgi:hypothetical protein
MRKAFYETEVMFVRRQLKHVIQERDALKESVIIAADEILKLQGRFPEAERKGCITSLVNLGKIEIKRRNYKK